MDDSRLLLLLCLRGLEVIVEVAPQISSPARTGRVTALRAAAQGSTVEAVRRRVGSLVNRPRVFAVMITLGWLVAVVGVFVGLILVLGALGDEEGVAPRVGGGFVVMVQSAITGAVLIGLGRMGQLLADVYDSTLAMNGHLQSLTEDTLRRRRDT
jgi:hypothetical protein